MRSAMRSGEGGCLPARRAGSALTAVALAASALVGLTAAAGPAAAADPVVGAACTSADLGKRVPIIMSAVVQPTLTHFKSYFVTTGTTGSQQVQLENTTVITVEVGTTTQISAEFNILTLGKVSAFANRSVKTITASTDKELQIITWNFNAPGYYALFKGTRKVTGEYRALQCDRVDKGDGRFATEWVERHGGNYTTYTSMEEGAIRCEDAVPPGTLLRMAQQQLGCEGSVASDAAERTPAPEKDAQEAAEKDAAEGVLAAFDTPPGFGCDAGYYRISTPDRLMNWYNGENSDNAVLTGRSSSSRAQWSLCKGPVTNGMTEHVFINRSDGKCLTVNSAEEPDDGGEFLNGSCRTVDDRQRFYIYQDVPGTNLIGVQLKSTGFMIGQNRVSDNESLRQYSIGKADGTGTYLLEKL